MTHLLQLQSVAVDTLSVETMFHGEQHGSVTLGHLDVVTWSSGVNGLGLGLHGSKGLGFIEVHAYMGLHE